MRVKFLNDIPRNIGENPLKFTEFGKKLIHGSIREFAKSKNSNEHP